MTIALISTEVIYLNVFLVKIPEVHYNKNVIVMLVIWFKSSVGTIVNITALCNRVL